METAEQTTVAAAETTQEAVVKAQPDLQARLAEAQREVDEYKAKYESLSRTHQKAIEEGKITKGLADTLTNLSAKIEDIELGQAVLHDRLATAALAEEVLVEEQSGTKASAVARLQAERERKKQERETARLEETLSTSAIEAANVLIDAAGMEYTDSSLQAAAQALQGKRFNEVLPLVKQAVSQFKQRKAADTDKQAQEAQKARERAEAQKRGELEISTATGTATLSGDAYYKAVRERYLAEGNTNKAVYDEYHKVRRERGL